MWSKSTFEKFVIFQKYTDIAMHINNKEYFLDGLL